MPAVILIVEDNDVDAICIRRAFAKAKVLNPVMCVQSGEEAIAYLKGEGQFASRLEFPLPDLVLLDLKLPGPRTAGRRGGQSGIEYRRMDLKEWIMFVD